MPNTKSSDIRYKVLDRYLRRGGYSTYELMNEVKIPIQLQYRIMNYCNGWRHKTTFASGWGPKPWNEEWSRSSCCATSQDSKRLRTEELYILERILVTFDPLKAILPGRFNPCPFILDCDAVKKGSGHLQISYVRSSIFSYLECLRKPLTGVPQKPHGFKSDFKSAQN